MSFMISRGRVDGNQVGLIVSFGPRNRFTKNGTIFERIRCVRAWSSIGSNGRIARDFSMMKSDLVGRFCETPRRQLLFAPGLYRNDVTDQVAKARFRVRRRDLVAAYEDDFYHLLTQMAAPFEDFTNAFIACPC